MFYFFFFFLSFFLSFFFRYSDPLYGPHEQELKRRALGQAPTTNVNRGGKKKKKKRKKKGGGTGAGRGSISTSTSTSSNKENRSSVSGGGNGGGRRPATAATGRGNKKMLLDPNRAGRDRRFTHGLNGSASSTPKNRPQTSTGVRRRRRRSREEEEEEEEEEDDDDGGFDSSMEVSFYLYRSISIFLLKVFQYFYHSRSHNFFFSLFLCFFVSFPPIYFLISGGVGSTEWECKWH
jgi:hypothetical protein